MLCCCPVCVPLPFLWQASPSLFVFCLAGSTFHILYSFSRLMSSSSAKGKHSKKKTNADGESLISITKKQHTKMSADGGGGGSSSSGASGTRPQQQQATPEDGSTAQPALHLSSDEVNYLIFRSVLCNAYLLVIPVDGLE